MRRAKYLAALVGILVLLGGFWLASPIESQFHQDPDPGGPGGMNWRNSRSGCV